MGCRTVSVHRCLTHSCFNTANSPPAQGIRSKVAVIRTGVFFMEGRKMGIHRTSKLSLTAVAALLAVATPLRFPSRARTAQAPMVTSSIYMVEPGIDQDYTRATQASSSTSRAWSMEVKVKLGDTIKEGAGPRPAGRLRREAEQEALVIEAKSTVQEDYAKSDQALNEKKLQKAGSSSTKPTRPRTSKWKEARLAIEKSKASVKISVEERTRRPPRSNGVTRRISLKTLKSPITGSSSRSTRAARAKWAASISRSRR